MVTLPQVDRFIAEQEIRDLSYRYARGADRLDADMFASAFWEDGAFNQPGEAPITAFAEQLVQIMGKHFALTHHLNGNMLIDFIDESHASSETYFQAYHLTKPDLTVEEAAFMIGDRRLRELSHSDDAVYDITVGGRYLDELERRGGVWKIKVRRLIFDYCTVRKSEALRPGEGMTTQGAVAMARDRSDPSYTYMRANAGPYSAV